MSVVLPIVLANLTRCGALFGPVHCSQCSIPVHNERRFNPRISRFIYTNERSTLAGHCVPSSRRVWKRLYVYPLGIHSNTTELQDSVVEGIPPRWVISQCVCVEFASLRYIFCIIGVNLFGKPVRLVISLTSGDCMTLCCDEAPQRGFITRYGHRLALQTRESFDQRG